MSIMRRMSDVFQQKVTKVLDRAEDPVQAIDLSYQKQLEALQQVRRSVAEVLTSEKRLEMQAAQLQQSGDKLQGQARLALQQGREDLAKLALTRAQNAQTQLDGLQQQIQQMKDQEQKLELTAQKLQAKVESFRTQRETLKAQYSAAQASTKIGEAVTGLSDQMADVTMMTERAQDRITQMQARASAIDQLVDSGTLDQIGISSGDDIDRQLQASVTDASVDSQLAAMKQDLLAAPAAPRLGAAAAPAPSTSAATTAATEPIAPAGESIVVRIHGEDQFSLAPGERGELDRLDGAIAVAVDSGDADRFHTALTAMLDFVRSHGTRLAADGLVASDAVLPSDDMTLDEAKDLLGDHGRVVDAAGSSSPVIA
ncbi:MAG TPA: PspA/IM30 family protein [Candidatus Micrarchaeia archaeon]|nr:PspA/IM30 family protein [Candidatus Micrarchaeia archaeon]